MESEQDSERHRLRSERDRLHEQIAVLVAKNFAVQDKRDSLARARYQIELEQHVREFRAFREDLERFRRLYGPLGE